MSISNIIQGDFWLECPGQHSHAVHYSKKLQYNTFFCKQKFEVSRLFALIYPRTLSGI